MRRWRRRETNGLVAADAPLPRVDAASSFPAHTLPATASYGLRELNQLRSLRELRRRFGVDLGEVAFARAAPARAELRAELADLAARTRRSTPLDWEQRKHERLLVA